MSGELLAAMYVMKYAVDQGIPECSLYYDYMGIEMWATKRWKRNNALTQQYAAFYDSIKNRVRVHFHKVAAHTGDIFIEMDVRYPKLLSVFEEFKPSIVFHEAAQTMVQSSMENPSYDCDVNLLGLINVLDACRKVKVEQFLMPSSAAVYGDLAVLPLTEELSGMPSSFYGLTKL